MSRLLVILVTVLACDSGKPKDTSPPISPTLDQSCRIDADCIVVNTACCVMDCDPIGQAVNANYWSRTSEQRERTCGKMQCPRITCPMLPKCRDESHAVCKQSTCTIERRPNAACAEAGSGTATP